ncbi:MAG: hypothetical protein JWQ11_4162, partial [Rhizobacter sp.]|nr:hypothetical protein [Rhizobacter sp.]
MQPTMSGQRGSRFTLRWALKFLIGVLLAVWSLVLIAWLGLQWGILPNIEQWRVPIEKRASKALGITVSIGHIEVQSSGWMPSMELREVRLLDGAQRVTLRLPKVSATVSLRSLFALELRFQQLVIDGAQLEIRRDREGRIFVAGLDTSGPDTGEDNGEADWFFKQREFAIRGGTLRWTDELRNAPALYLSDVNLVIRNGLRSHDVQLDASPPPEWGDRFTLAGKFTHRLLSHAGDVQRWSGQAYAMLPRADLHLLRRYLTLPFETAEGDGAVRAWIDIEAGLPRQLTADVALRTITLQWAHGEAPLSIEQVQGRLLGQRDSAGYTLAAKKFGFQTADGLVWPRTDLDMTWAQPPDAPRSNGGAVRAERLDLNVVAQIAARLPVGRAVRNLLDDVAPQGNVNGLVANWEGALDAPTTYKVKTRLSDLTLSPGPVARATDIGRPGLQGAQIELDATERGGTALVSMANGAVELPGVYAEPKVPVDQLSGKLAWVIQPVVQRGDLLGASPGSAPISPPVPPEISVHASEIKFANVDTAGEIDARWHTGPGTGYATDGRFPGNLVLDGRISRGKADRLHRYLPLELPAEVRTYLRTSLLGGNLRDSTVRIAGDLADFPFTVGRKGEFRLAAKVDDVTFAYVPEQALLANGTRRVQAARGASSASVSAGGSASVGSASTSTAISASAGGTVALPADEVAWPVLHKMSGDIVFDRSSMTLRNVQAQIGGMQFTKVQGEIADMENHPVLTIDGQTRAAAAEMLQFVKRTPIGEWTSHALHETTVTGDALLQLGMHIPLDDVERTTVKGSVTLAGNDVRVRGDLPAFDNTSGRVDFTEAGFSIVDGAARLLGGAATFAGGVKPDGSMRFDAQGVATADALRRATELGFVSRVAASLDGQAAWKGSVGLRNGQTELSITSDLVGMGSAFPAPLKKAAGVAMPLAYSTTLVSESLSAGKTPRDVMKLELGNGLHVSYLRELGARSTRVISGGIGLQEPAPTPAAGVAANITVGSLNAEAWQAVADRLSADTPVVGSVAGTSTSTSTSNALASVPGTAATTTRAAAASAAAATSSEGDGYLPTSVGLRVQELTTGSRRITRLVAGFSNVDGLWRGNIDADQLNGYVEYRPARTTAGGSPANAAGGVYARLARLQLPESDANEVESLLDEQPASVPALDIVVDDFELRGKRLGRVEIEAVNRMSGEGRDALREWQLSRFIMSTPEAQMTASGNWAVPAAGGKRRTAMTFRLDLADSGAYLGRLGTPGAIKGGKGRVQGSIGWTGSPTSLDYASMTGQMNIAIDEGQFLKVNPGAARLLGVLSLQALPRRFAFDFRDLFEKGFAFDSITGDVAIKQGVASTQNLRMRGVPAVVVMAGSADLERETQDLRVVVVPEINAGTASLAVAALNPALGLGTYLAQLFLRKPMVQAGTREYHVSGDWADPKVDRVARKMSEPIPELARALPADEQAEAASAAASAAADAQAAVEAGAARPPAALSAP